MPRSLHTKLHKIIGLLIRYVVPVLAILYLGYSLLHLPRETVSGWISSFSFSLSDHLIFVCLLLLSVSQWLIEAWKWKMLASKLERISLQSAFVGVLYGLSVGMLTPKRTGEVAGRAFLLQAGNRVQGMVLNIAAALSQLTITLIAGMLALALIMFQETAPSASPLIGFSDPAWRIYSLALIGLIVLLMGLKPATTWLLRKKVSWLKPVAALQQVSGQELWWLLTLSGLRYLVFSFQFYLLILLFDTPISLAEATILLAIMLLALTALPVPAIAEAGVRGSVALLVTELLFVNNLPAIQVGVTASMIGLWLINIAFPAAIGAILGLTTGISQQPITQHR